MVSGAATDPRAGEHHAPVSIRLSGSLESRLQHRGEFAENPAMQLDGVVAITGECRSRRGAERRPSAGIGEPPVERDQSSAYSLLQRIPTLVVHEQHLACRDDRLKLHGTDRQEYMAVGAPGKKQPARVHDPRRQRGPVVPQGRRADECFRYRAAHGFSHPHRGWGPSHDPGPDRPPPGRCGGVARTTREAGRRPGGRKVPRPY